MKEYDKVRIKSTGIIGTIVSITSSDAEKVYTVESDTPDLTDGYGGKWRLFDCREAEIESV